MHNTSVAVRYCLFSKVERANPFLSIDPKRTPSQDGSHELSFEALMRTYWVWVKGWWVRLRQWLSASQNILSKLVHTSLRPRCFLKPNKHNKQMSSSGSKVKTDEQWPPEAAYSNRFSSLKRRNMLSSSRFRCTALSPHSFFFTLESWFILSC